MFYLFEYILEIKVDRRYVYIFKENKSMGGFF